MPINNNTLKGVSLRIDKELERVGTVTAITGYRDTRQDQQNDTDYSKADIFKTVFADHFKQLSQEVRLASSDKEKLRYTAGLYLMKEDAETDRSGQGGRDLNTLVRVPFAPVALPIGPTFGWTRGQIGRNWGTFCLKIRVFTRV